MTTAQTERRILRSGMAAAACLLASVGAAMDDPALRAGALDPVASARDLPPADLGPRLADDLDDGATASAPATDPPPVATESAGLAKETCFWLLNGGLAIGYTVYGGIAWDWGTASFHTQREHWFSRSARYGGADKLGHAFSAYSLSAIFCELYDHWGYDQGTASMLGVLSGWTHTMLIEVGDGISDAHGLSYEDAIMNTAGAALQYLRRSCPRLRDTVDFRWEYHPSPAVRHGDSQDIFTDYSGSRYAITIKPEGLLRTGGWLRFLELHGGYGTRGYVREDAPYIPQRSQRLYLGAGISVSELLGLVTRHDARRFFEYYQVPYTYLAADHQR
jgi:hypothetical protein